MTPRQPSEEILHPRLPSRKNQTSAHPPPSVNVSGVLADRLPENKCVSRIKNFVLMVKVLFITVTPALVKSQSLPTYSRPCHINTLVACCKPTPSKERAITIVLEYYLM